MNHISLQQRIELFNQAYPHLHPLHCDLNDNAKPMICGVWFLGGAKQAEFYGSYSIEYLRRCETLFQDATKVVHLFCGAMPAGPYTRVGIDPSGKGTQPDIVGDAEKLSSFLPFKADLIYADPPYTETEAEEKYQISLCNGPKVLSECAQCLQPGGFVVWLDTRLPVFNNNELRWVGEIVYIRSTGNRIRGISIFQKPLK